MPTNKQFKIGQTNTHYCAKKDAYSVAEGIITGSGIKSAEHKY